MVERSYDPAVFRRATECYRKHIPEDFDFEGWLANHQNIMCVSGNSVGLATFEYPGVYNCHWFYEARGKEAIKVALEMYDYLFNNTDCQVVRGITPVHLRGARYLAKRIGFVSLGIEEFPDGPEEVMCLTKDAFIRKQAERYGS